MTAITESERKLPDPELLEGLAPAEHACVTIFLPAHKGGTGTISPAQRLRGLIGGLEQQARDEGMRTPDVEDLFAPLHRLASDGTFTAGHCDSYAILRSIRHFEVLRVPGEPLEGAWLENRFRILPLLERMAARPAFYLLALTRRRVRLFNVEMGEFTEMALPPGVIAGLDEFNAFDPPDHMLRNKSSAGAGASVAFGTGSEREKMGRHFRDFCNALDRGLRPMLLRTDSPLVLAGTTPEVATYREVCGYQHLVHEAVTLSPDGGWSDSAIVQRGREVAAAWVSPELQRILDQFDRKVGTGHALSEGVAIGAAAAAGRVAILLVAEGTRMPRAGGDIVNTAEADTLTRDGVVRIVPSGQAAIPPFAAILRY
jgi:hypothetical protein